MKTQNHLHGEAIDNATEILQDMAMMLDTPPITPAEQSSLENLDTQINGRAITRVKGTAFVALPRGLWREIPGGCACQYCSPDPKQSQPAYWDTMAIAAAPLANSRMDYVTTCHYPEINGAKARRA